MRGKVDAASSRRSSIIRRESSGKKLMEQSRIRLMCIAARFFSLLRCHQLPIGGDHADPSYTDETVQASIPAARTDEQMLEDLSAPLKLARNDIVDRNGVVLATTLATESLFANPRRYIGSHRERRISSWPFFRISTRGTWTKKLARDSSFRVDQAQSHAA